MWFIAIIIVSMNKLAVAPEKCILQLIKQTKLVGL